MAFINLDLNLVPVGAIILSVFSFAAHRSYLTGCTLTTASVYVWSNPVQFLLLLLIFDLFCFREIPLSLQLSSLLRFWHIPLHIFDAE